MVSLASRLKPSVYVYAHCLVIERQLLMQNEEVVEQTKDRQPNRVSFFVRQIYPIEASRDFHTT